MILLWLIEHSLLWHYYGILFDNVILFVSGNYKLNVLVCPFTIQGCVLIIINFILRYQCDSTKCDKMWQNGITPGKNTHKIILSRALEWNFLNLCLTIPLSVWTLSITLFLKEIFSYQDSRRTNLISWHSVSPFFIK